MRGTGDENDYISLTDLAKAKGPDPSAIIGNWMRNKDTIALLGVWEKLNNPFFRFPRIRGNRKKGGRF
ncbi:KilA-N domain-containing protein [Bifidobacterium longum]|uniref:KilA-N domain-containing protein n=1 Tax=Bifidobacterium longum TaxID=216816 RepID=UPI0035BC4949